MAESACGIIGRDTVYLIKNDRTPPSYELSGMLEGRSSGDVIPIECSKGESLSELEVSASLVQFYDECDPAVSVDFIDRYEGGNCRVDGYIRKRMVEWIATDACGNQTNVEFTWELRDTEAPQFLVGPPDIILGCGEDLPATNVIASDACQQSVELKYEDSTPESTAEGTRIIRTWTAHDGCGNYNTMQQNIVYENTDLQCRIKSKIVDCDAENVELFVDVSGGLGPYSYEWFVEGGVSEIIEGQGTSRILLDVGFTDTEISVVVKDINGCITTCSTIIRCELEGRIERRAFEDDSYALYQNRPNPFRNSTIIGFRMAREASATITVFDAMGREVYKQTERYNYGLNEITLRNEVLPAAGIYYYELSTKGFRAVKQMIIVE
jgi:hypothetical protein